ncbi:MAG TPA: hypothetical protein VNM40_03440 [Candidatus Paceibacterota bacterium]|nr:hypothetical protein [Candidatus Paceibacterota bacterium]
MRHLAYHFPLCEAMWLALMRGSPEPVKSVLSRSLDIPENCGWACFLRSHDEISLATLSPEE